MPDKSSCKEGPDAHGKERARAKQAGWWRRLFSDPPLPEQPVPLTRSHFLCALFVFAVSLTVYTMTIGPTVTGEDSGELITAAYTMGVPHPPGYPLWCLLGKLFTIIVPFNSIAWRVGFMVAFLAAGTTALMSLIIIKITSSRLAGISASLTFAFSYQFWKQGVIAEMYSLNAFITALCILILFAWYESRRTKLLLLFALAYGLGLCNHHTMHFTGPLFGLFILSVDRRPWLNWRVYLSMAGIAFTAWGLVHLYLPLRAMTNPPINWGNPSTWEGFWDSVMRQQYTFGFTKNIRTFGRVVQQTWVFVQQYSHEFTPWLALVPLLGVYPLWNRNKYHLGILLGGFLYITFGFILIINFNMDKESVWVNSKFWIPAYMFAGLLMGVALDAMGRLRIWGRSLAWPAGVLMAIVPVLPLHANYETVDKSKYFFAHDYASNILKTLDKDAVFFPVADHATFPILYLQAVEGLRPDVTIANKYGYTEESLIQEMPIEQRIRFGKIPGEADQTAIEDWFVSRGDRPVFFTRKRPIDSVPGAKMIGTGLLYKAVNGSLPETQAPERDYWAEYSWHTLDTADTRGEYTADAVMADYYFAHGRYLLEKGRTAEGLQSLQTALEVAGDTKETLNNIGSACGEYGRLKEAAEYFARAIDLDPDYALSLKNLAKTYVQLGEGAKAVRPLEHALELKSDDAEALWAMAQALKGSSKPSEALAALQRLQELTPEDPGVYREMGMIHLEQLNDIQQARVLFGKSLQLKPDQPELLSYMSDQTMPVSPGVQTPAGEPGASGPPLEGQQGNKANVSTSDPLGLPDMDIPVDNPGVPAF